MNLVLVKGYHICTQSMWGECARECEDGGGGRDRAGAGQQSQGTRELTAEPG